MIVTDYNEMLKRADEWEKQAKELTERVERIRQEAAAAAAASDKKVNEAKENVVDAIVTYFEALGMQFEDDELNEFCEMVSNTLGQLEKEFKMLDSLVNKLKTAPVLKRDTGLTDDEKLKRFIKILNS